MQVLFFSIRPVYDDLVAKSEEVDYSEQIHASWLLAHVDDPMLKATIRQAYRQIGYSLNGF